jgi:hypothetical protein
VEKHPPNTLEINGEYFAMEGQPLEAYFAMSSIPPILLPDGEGYWSGYLALWSLRGERLYLNDWQTKEDFKYRFYEFSFEYFFSEFANCVFAHWFSGQIHCRSVADYEARQLCEADHDVAQILTFRRGVLTSSRRGRVMPPDVEII